MIWCKNEISSISDLKGKKVRVFLTTLADFVESVGAIPVNAPFKGVAHGLQTGAIDCAITGTMSAYTGELYKVANYGFKLRVGWGLAFGAMNLSKWQLLSKDQQQLMEDEFAKLTQRMWQETATEDAIALACLSNGPCNIGPNGNMTLIEPSQQDLEIRNHLAQEVILPRWASRCGPECAANWNRSVGKLLKLNAKAL